MILFPSAARADDLVNTDVTFGGLHGTVVATPGSDAKRPGLVLVAGAGSRGRDAYRPEAEAFARAGIVVLIYDKRADYSRATSDFARLADDAAAGVKLLKSRPDVGRVGVWGHSEGGWVAPLAAVRSPDVDFVITAGASALTADRTQLWSNRTYLTDAGVVPRLHAALGDNLSRMLISANLFGDVSNDPVAVLRQVRKPLLALVPERDRSTVPGESVTLFKQALDQGHNKRYAIRVIPGADHEMKDLAYVPGMASWISDPPAVASADPPPRQEVASAPVKPPAWYESVWLQLAVLGVMLVAFCFGGWRLAVAGIVTVLGTAMYLFAIVATGATELGPVFLGRPAVWLVLQFAAVGVVVLGALRWRRAYALLAFVPWAAYWGLLTP